MSEKEKKCTCGCDEHSHCDCETCGDDEIVELSKNVHNVFLVGVLNRSEVMREMSEADVFVFLSKYIGEGFSNALAEAMASGLPCLVSDWAANADMIENKGGIVVESNDVNEINFGEVDGED